MNSIFSSFDALSAELLGQSVNRLSTRSPAVPHASGGSGSGTVLVDQKKVKHEKNGNGKGGGCSARWAPEFDGLHCYESLVFH
ncbi:hypothetical protein SSX86_012032 [Deinandra increscens subsp. villosa]|uniref:Uncharacterized protein n=1 Tax=Deinandra increscens subsp. villosa TaxID=3103831 RepID=A0AAP0GYD7_9ASTR